MRRKIHWKTIFMMLLFASGVLLLSVVVFSPLCLTYTGTILFLITIVLVCYSGTYLYLRYEKIL